MKILHDVPVIVGLTALVVAALSTGCASRSAGASAGSDHLRESRLAPSSRPAAPARGGAIADPPVPARFPSRAATGSPRGADEPDPNALIDWLLNQRR